MLGNIAGEDGKLHHGAKQLSSHLGQESEEWENPGKGGTVANLSAASQQRTEPANKPNV